MPLSRREFIVHEPSVYVIGVQQVNEPELREFLTDEGYPDWTSSAVDPAEMLCEVAGRTCYMSFAGGRDHAQYIENIKKDRHGSVLEHATITFILTGVSRSFSHECVRHRVGWSYSQLSQRFVDEANAQFILPSAFDKVSRLEDRQRIRGIWETAVRTAHDAYGRLVGELEWALCPDRGAGTKSDTRARKLIRGAARSVLPSACETKIVATVNARALRHFFELRASEAADAEIRAVALKIYQAALRWWPDILSDYMVATGADGEPYLTTQYVKV